MKLRNPFASLTKFELALWCVSVIIIVLSFLLNAILGATLDYLSLIASLIGITSLIFAAKGDVFGQILIVVFSVFYGLISYSFGYYGEMITYLGMTTPIAIMSIVSWLRHPFEKGKAEVKVNSITLKEVLLMLAFSAVVTFVFYFILRFFSTTNLLISTISITTSFLASYLTFRRSSFYAMAYAANDVVLIVLWVLATIKDTSYLPMIICFSMFLINDMYGFFNWKRMRKRQIEAHLTKNNIEIE